MHHLFDTNIVIELNKHNLLEAALKALKINRQDLYILKELVHKMASNTPDWKGDKPFSSKHLRRCQKFCDGLSVITNPYTDPAEMNALQTKQPYLRVNGRSVKIDEGEAQLFAFTRQLADFRLYTADRSALNALTSWPNCEAVRSRLVGKVYCLERVMREIINTHGFAKLPESVGNHSGVVGKAFAAGETQCASVLLNAEAEMQATLGGFLAA